MKRLCVVAVMIGLSAGCVGQRAMYAGPIKMRSDTPPGLMLEGQEKRPIECYTEAEDSFSDLKEGQWAIVEGIRSQDRHLAINLRECRVIAVAVSNVGDIPGMELRRRNPTPPVNRTPSAPSRK